MTAWSGAISESMPAIIPALIVLASVYLLTLAKLGYAKEIPRDVCDKGCKFWTDADIDFDTIKKFLKSEKQIMEDKQNGNRTTP